MALLIPDHSVFNGWSNFDLDDDDDFLREIFLRQKIKNAIAPSRKRPYSRALSHTSRLWPESLLTSDISTPTVKLDKNKFQVNLDVHQFKPDEIKVKVVDNLIIVDAHHEEQQDEHGWISRKFQRKYSIPDDCDSALIKSALSSDGVLTLTVPKKAELTASNERTIPIEMTGKPAIREVAKSSETVEDTSNVNKKSSSVKVTRDDSIGPKDVKRRKKDVEA